MDYYVGDVVKMRKPHPCGGFDWEVLRAGMDFRVQCLKCKHMLMLSRPKFEKSVKKLISRNTLSLSDNDDSSS